MARDQQGSARIVLFLRVLTYVLVAGVVGTVVYGFYSTSQAFEKENSRPLAVGDWVRASAEAGMQAESPERRVIDPTGKLSYIPAVPGDQTCHLTPADQLKILAWTEDGSLVVEVGQRMSSRPAPAEEPPHCGQGWVVKVSPVAVIRPPVGITL